MRHLPIFLVFVLLVACRNDMPQRRGAIDTTQMRTIDTVPPQPAAFPPPPMLQDEAPPPKPKRLPWEPPTTVVLTPEDEKVRASLPFSPAIAMDPINGDKISIRANTPTFEYEGKIYYFSSEAMRQQFIANPTAAVKGTLIKL
ncbi:MAG: hypothetical protein WA208_10495 [Thermoanaerobaculia bacterium]